MSVLARPCLAVVASSRRRSGVPPLPTTNLLVRYKADAGVTNTSGRVTAWADQTANGLDATGDANAPYFASDYRGQPVVRFDSQSTTGMSLGGARTFTARNIAVFIVGRFVPASVTLVSGAGATSGLLRMLPASAGSTIALYAATRFATPPIRIRSNPSLFGMVAETGATALYTNLETATGMLAVTSTTGTGLALGRFTSNAWSNIDAHEILIYEGTVTSQTIADIKAYAAAQYGLRTTAYTKNVVFEGDSISAGSAVTPGNQFALTSYPAQVLRTATEDWKISNLSVSGASVASLTTRAAGCDGYFDAACSKNILCVLVGRNDVTTADNSATVYSDLVTYVQARVAAGWTVWAGTCIATGASLQPTLGALNSKIRGTPLGGTGPGIIADAGASKVLDFAALPEFDATGDASNTTYYQGDATHPTTAGSGLLADYVAPLLAAA